MRGGGHCGQQRYVKKQLLAALTPPLECKQSTEAASSGSSNICWPPCCLPGVLQDALTARRMSIEEDSSQHACYWCAACTDELEGQNAAESLRLSSRWLALPLSHEQHSPLLLPTPFLLSLYSFFHFLSSTPDTTEQKAVREKRCSSSPCNHHLLPAHLHLSGQTRSRQ